MNLPTPYWPSLAFCILLGMLCRRWPVVALYGATYAFCEVSRGILRLLPHEPLVVFADVVLFVLPSVPLTKACGASDWRVAARFLTIPIAIGIGHVWGSEVRVLFLPLGVAFGQGTAALTGFVREAKDRSRDMQRWAGVCIAAIGLIAIGFSPVWSDIAWTGVAAHGFACLAYVVNERE